MAFFFIALFTFVNSTKLFAFFFFLLNSTSLPNHSFFNIHYYVRINLSQQVEEKENNRVLNSEARWKVERLGVIDKMLGWFVPRELYWDHFLGTHIGSLSWEKKIQLLFGRRDAVPEIEKLSHLTTQFVSKLNHCNTNYLRITCC